MIFKIFYFTYRIFLHHLLEGSQHNHRTHYSHKHRSAEYLHLENYTCMHQDSLWRLMGKNKSSERANCCNLGIHRSVFANTTPGVNLRCPELEVSTLFIGHVQFTCWLHISIVPPKRDFSSIIRGTSTFTVVSLLVGITIGPYSQIFDLIHEKIYLGHFALRIWEVSLHFSWTLQTSLVILRCYSCQN